MFNARYGLPVGNIVDSKQDGIAFLLTENDEGYDEKYLDDLYDPYELAAEEIYGIDGEDRSYLSGNDLQKLEDAIESGKEPKDWKIKKVYDKVQAKIKEYKGKEFYLDDGQISPIPIEIPDQNERIYIAGPSGSGKSTFINKWLKFKLRLDPDTKVYVFSKLDEDKSLEKDIKDHINRIALNQELVEDPMEASDFPKGSVVIFDDIDTIKDEKVLKAVKKLRDDLLETGRHEDLTIFTVSHTIMNYKSTKASLNECTSVVLFPKGNQHQITRFLKEYMGFSPKMIQKCLKLRSRWFEVVKNYPTFVLHEHGGFIID